jgi:hypothetical protein
MDGATMNPRNDPASEEMSDEDIETNVDLDKLRAAKVEHERKLALDWAQRLAKSGRYSDAAEILSQLEKIGIAKGGRTALTEADYLSLQLLAKGASQKGSGAKDLDGSATASQRSLSSGPTAEPPAPNLDAPTHSMDSAPPDADPLNGLLDQAASEEPIGHIGTLTHVAPDKVWSKSNFDIASWLAENSDLIKDTLGFELRKIPGGFSGGSSRFEDSAGRKVAISTCLGESNDAEVGQLLSELAALSASVAVWIVGRPRREDLAVARWLNRLGANLHLVKLEAVRIDNSAPAPLLSLLAGGPGQDADR